MTKTFGRLSRLLSITCMLAVGAAVLGCALPASADDLNPPWWRGLPGTTSQQWLFNTPAPGAPDGFSNNPYGPPVFVPNATWGDEEFGRQGFYRSPDAMTFEIPNRPDPNDRKLIRVQITWWGDAASGILNIFTNPASNSINESKSLLPDGWWHGTWDLVIPFNPPIEAVHLTGQNILVDQVVIDTWCVPEPGSIATLAGGLLGMVAVLRRRR